MSHNQPNPQSVNRQSFRLACYEFQLFLDSDLELPPFKGASFHGALGLALAKIGTHFRDYFYNPTPPPHWQERQNPPKPYLLIPPLEEQTLFMAGDTLNLGIVLYGNAIDYLMIIFAALNHLGEHMGLGPKRGRFRISQINQLTSDGTTRLYQHPHWLGQSQPLVVEHFFTNTPPISRLQIKHSTRLRLKSDNNLLRTAPPFSLLMHRLLSRINSLATLYGNGIVITPEEKQYLLTLAETISIDQSNLKWHDWQRYSQRSQSSMPFGGLLGETVYRGELTPFLPWLALGQWIGIGGKTTFGLGLYELSLISNNEDEWC